MFCSSPRELKLPNNFKNGPFVFPFDPLRENSDIIAEPEVILSFQLDQTKYEGCRAVHIKTFSSLFDQMLDVLKIK